MFCRLCGATVPDDSRFCRQCGKPVAADATPAASPAAPAPARPPAAPPEPESEVWTGGVSARSMAGGFLFAGLWLAVFVTLTFVRTIGGPRWTPYLLAFACVPAVCELLLLARERLRLGYRLTTERLFVREGILVRRHTELELVRVKDVEVRESLVGRLVKTGRVVVTSTDASDPALTLEGIARPHDVKEMIREAVQKRRRGAMYVERI